MAGISPSSLSTMLTEPVYSYWYPAQALVMVFMMTRWMQRAEISDAELCAVPVVSSPGFQLTRGAFQADLATVLFPRPRVSDARGPPILDAVFERLADVCLGVNDPYPVG